MKDLIVIFNYSPDNNRKKILQELLDKLKNLRDRFDILVVSHSSISEISYDDIDYFYYDKNNKLLYDFDLNNNFWFKTNTFKLNSTTVYSKSTHLAIYSLLYYTFNFANHKQYNKVHCIEYDINLTNENLIVDVNNTLDDYDTVMFEREDGWIYGTYFAFNMNNFPDDYFKYDEENILNILRDSDSRMTENITPIILRPNGRTILLEPISKLDPNGIFQKVDNHNNDELNWCVPVCDNKTNNLYIFIYNTTGKKFNIDVLYNEKHLHLKSEHKNVWNLTSIGDIDEVNKIQILVNGEIKKEISITEDNKETFKKYNLIDFI
jgi:hypothetical protein